MISKELEIPCLFRLFGKLGKRESVKEAKALINENETQLV